MVLCNCYGANISTSTKFTNAGIWFNGCADGCDHKQPRYRIVLCPDAVSGVFLYSNRVSSLDSNANDDTADHVSSRQNVVEVSS